MGCDIDADAVKMATKRIKDWRAETPSSQSRIKHAPLSDRA